MISVRGRLTSLNSTCVVLIGSAPSYTWPISPSAQETVTWRRSLSAFFASAAPTTAGMPSSRATIAAWQVRPPRSVTMPAEIFITGSQSGVVDSATSTSPGLKSRKLMRVGNDPHRTGGDLLADRAARRQHGS